MKRFGAFWLLALLVAGCAPPTPACPAAPRIVAFGASPNIMTADALRPSTLTWDTRDATRATIAPGVGEVPLAGSLVVTPTASLTYTLTITGCGGVATQPEWIVVNPAGALGVKAFRGMNNPAATEHVRVWVHAQAAQPLALIEIVVETPSGNETFTCARTAACDADLGYRAPGFALTYWARATNAGTTIETPRFTFALSK